MNQIEVEQRTICDLYGAEYCPSYPFQQVGLADNISSCVLPINGLRHIPENGTCGWYIWSGVQLGSSDDFFKPYHVSHLYDVLPDILRFIGLPPGWRFLIANNYEDVWYDPSLLIE